MGARGVADLRPEGGRSTVSSQRLPRPCSPDVAVARARKLADLELARRPADRHPYILGGGRFDPRHPDAEPWTLPESARSAVIKKYGRERTGLDCRGFVTWCYQLVARRDGFNSGGSVSGWINTDSMIEDALSSIPDLFRIAKAPAPGVLVVYPSIRRRELTGYTSDLGKRVRIGHVGIVEVYRGAEWDAAQSECWALLDVIQCGSTGVPAVRSIDGSLWGRSATYKPVHPITRQSSTITRPEWGPLLLEIIP